MNGTDKAHRVVVLVFEAGPRVDIVANMTEAEAIADFAGRALASEFPPSLPLLAGVTAAIPRERLLALLNGDGRAAEPPSEPPLPKLSAAGMVQAVRAYMGALGAADRTDGGMAQAKADFIAFFDRYGVEVDFTVARPVTATEEWTKA